MLKNIDAEQARNGWTDTDIALKLDIRRETYLRKKQQLKFNLNEIRKMCLIFGCSFDYLFEVTKNQDECKYKIS